jgi:hypothetical protein
MEGRERGLGKKRIGNGAKRDPLPTPILPSIVNLLVWKH